ncbi:hypothetical protein EC973_006518 [Apophysomyces ossiformis]|uniref:non-specific serine/threonine protein kinase n=1 Tax=Apophysomyces ossiformis TaxID=679940 RepID=A0A8H7BVY5_9FUNG|nr:hypothetical protein EC973_006518 [Apophysomyces ossiformis]
MEHTHQTIPEADIRTMEKHSQTSLSNTPSTQFSDRLNPYVTTGSVTPTTEITNPQSPSTSSKLRSVPIPQPLLLKRRTSRSSISSHDDTTDHTSHYKPAAGGLARSVTNSASAQLSPIALSNTENPNSPTGSIGGPRKSWLSDMEYSSSPGSEVDTPFSMQAPHGTGSPQSQCHSVQMPFNSAQRSTSGTSSPRYASPPAGSGGKYMVKSKRASWIDASAATGSVSNQPDSSSPSAPSTPVFLPEHLAKARKSSTEITPVPAKSSERHDLESRSYHPASLGLMHKSGSLSRLRENRTPGTPPHRENHLDSVAPLSPSSNEQALPANSLYERNSRPKRCSYADGNATDMEEVASTASTDTQNASPALWHGLGRRHTQRGIFHERTSSISSIVSDSSITTDEYYSPASSPYTHQSPQIGSPLHLPTPVERGDVGKGSSRPEYIAIPASTSIIHNNVSMPPAASTSTQGNQKMRRRSSMSILKYIPSSELANIVSGNSPNPVSDGSSCDVAITSPHPLTRPSTPDTSTPSTALNGGIPVYQHSLQSFLRRQLSSKRKTTRDRRSLPTPELSGNVPDADRDVIEIQLDDGPSTTANNRAEYANECKPFNSGRSDTGSLQSPVYPALLLNAEDSGIESETDSNFLFFTNSCGATSVPEMDQREERNDYFGSLNEIDTTEDKSEKADYLYNTELPQSPSLFSIKYQGTDEEYGRKLFLSRSAKIKRWCSLRIQSAGEAISAPTSPVTARTPTARISRQFGRDSSMPKILVTAHDGGTDSEITEPGNSLEKLNIVNDIPWVDWLEEYNVMKNAEIKRRSVHLGEHDLWKQESTQEEDKQPQVDQSGSVVNRVLSEWWNTVKANAEHFSFPRRSHRNKQQEKPHHEISSQQVADHGDGHLKKPVRHRHKLSVDFHDLKSQFCAKPSPTGKDMTDIAERRYSTVDDSALRRWMSSPSASEPPLTAEQPLTASPMVTASRLHIPAPQTPSPLTPVKPNAYPDTLNTSRIGYRFHHPGNRMLAFSHLGNVFSSSNENERIQHTIKSRLQFAKHVCDGELRRIIDGLNEYVEHGLQYVEDMHEIIEEGADSTASEDENYQEEMISHGKENVQAQRDIVEHDLPNSHVPSVAMSPSRLRSIALSLDDIEEQEETLISSGHSSDGSSLDGADQRLRKSGNVHEPIPTMNDTHDVQTRLALISEDSYLPTPFILTLQDLISLAQNIMDTPLDTILDNPGACGDVVSDIQAIGIQWDTHPEWPCREWYVRLLLCVAALNRVVEWWEAERGFWSASWTPSRTPSISVSDTDGADFDSVSGTSAADGTQQQINNEHDGTMPAADRSYDNNLQLQEAAERSQNSTIIMELSLGTTSIQYVSPVWSDVIGTDPLSVIGSNISWLLSSDDKSMFTVATEELLADDSRTVEVRFNLALVDGSILEMEGKGMLMYNRVTGEPSHTMWVIKPVVTRTWSVIDQPDTPKLESIDSTRQQPEEDIDVPLDEEKQLLRHRSMSVPVIDTQLGRRSCSAIMDGQDLSDDETDENNKQLKVSEIARVRKFLSQNDLSIAEKRANATSTLMSLPPVLCRVCERWVVAAFFEQHSELCVEIHKTEMDVDMCNDNLRELKHHAYELLEAAKEQIRAYEQGEEVPVMEQQKPDRSDDDERDSMFGDDLPIEQAIHPIEAKKAEAEVYEDLIQILDVALSISTPGTSDEENEDGLNGSPSGEDRKEAGSPRSIQSPRSKDRMVEIMYWRPPAVDDSEISSFILDVEREMKAKVETVNRMRDRLEYNERARADFQRTMQQDANWTEFVSGDNDQASHMKAHVETNEDDQTLKPKSDGGENKLPRKSFIDRLKLWKNRSSSTMHKLSRFRKHRLPEQAAITPVVEMETIETPMASPALRPKPVNESVSGSGNSSVSSSKNAMGKSPLSPLQAPIPSRPTPPSIKDFDIIKPISKGAFGSVFLAKKRATGDYYAIKFLKKSDMIAKNQVTNVKAERMILMTQTDSPFVTKLCYTFQSKDYLYLVLEYLNGGDCSALIKVLGSLPEDWARNYLAEVTLGLEYLQSRNVIHRDLKPDNLLIDQNGHLKLTDFGLSRIGFLDRRVRDELSADYRNGGRVLPTSPAPSRSGTPPHGTDNPSTTSDGIYRHSYFSLLFDQARRGSGASTLEEPANAAAETSMNITPTSSNNTAGAQRRNGTETPNNIETISATNYLHSERPSGKDCADNRKHAVGTPDYLAPESILGTGQDSMLDWWALGVICYEFLYGCPPFHAETPDRVFENILSRRIDWHEDEIEISPEARDFMERLMTLDPKKRLGYNGAEEVKNHPFFKDINWDTLLTESPAFVPQPTGMEDTDYFDARGATMLQSTEGLEESEKMQVERAKAIIQEQNPEKLTPMSDEASQVEDKNDFGTFTYKNLPMLEKANEDAIRKIRNDSISVSGSEICSEPGSSKLLHRSLPAIPRKQRNFILGDLTPSSRETHSVSGVFPSPSSSTSSKTLASASRRSMEPHPLSSSESTRLTRSRSASSPGDRAQALATLSGKCAAKQNDSSRSETRSKPLDCLVADDNPISCKILETILQRLQCRCVIVRNGAQAIRSAMSDVQFDMIFMDIRMPIIDGETVARMIKSTNNVNRDTPIIAVTAYERTVQLAGAFDDILSKPVTKDTILQRIRQFCQAGVDVHHHHSAPIPQSITS